MLTGILAAITLTIGTDVVLHAIGVFPQLGQPIASTLLLLVTPCHTVYGVAGSYITARLAPDRPMQHALVGGAVGLALSVVGAVATWNRGPAFWAPLVSRRVRDALRLGRRQTPRHAVAGTHGGVINLVAAEEHPKRQVHS